MVELFSLWDDKDYVLMDFLLLFCFRLDTHVAFEHGALFNIVSAYYVLVRMTLGAGDLEVC